MIRVLLACALGGVASLVATRFLIRWMSGRHLHQPIQEDGVPGHLERKKGTPTLGGIGVIVGLTVGYLASGVVDASLSREGALLLALAIGCCGIGLLDDWDKVSSGSNAGISASTKLRLQFCAATAFAIAVLALSLIHI